MQSGTQFYIKWASVPVYINVSHFSKEITDFTYRFHESLKNTVTRNQV